MEQFKETLRQKQVADYNAYLQLKQLNYSDQEITEHMGYTDEGLGDLIAKFKS